MYLPGIKVLVDTRRRRFVSKVYCVKLVVEEGNPGWTLKRTGGSAANLTAVANVGSTRALVGLGLPAQGSQG